jgi:hypothetical protein
MNAQLQPAAPTAPTASLALELASECDRLLHNLHCAGHVFSTPDSIRRMICAHIGFTDRAAMVGLSDDQLRDALAYVRRLASIVARDLQNGTLVAPDIIARCQGHIASWESEGLPLEHAPMLQALLAVAHDGGHPTQPFQEELARLVAAAQYLADLRGSLPPDAPRRDSIPAIADNAPPALKSVGDSPADPDKPDKPGIVKTIVHGLALAACCALAGIVEDGVIDIHPGTSAMAPSLAFEDGSATDVC